MSDDSSEQRVLDGRAWDDFCDALNVYGDTGKADVTSTIDPSKQGYVASRIGTVEEWAKQPGWYSAPRQIQFGLSVGF